MIDDELLPFGAKLGVVLVLCILLAALCVHVYWRLL